MSEHTTDVVAPSATPTARTVVFVARRPPFPLNGGTAIRMYHLVAGYAAVAKVRFIYLVRTPAEIVDGAGLGSLGVDVQPVMVPPDVTTSSTWSRRFRQLASARPILASSGSAGMQDAVEQVARTADLVHVGSLGMVPSVERLLQPGRPRRPRFVLSLDDVETHALARQLALLPAPRWQRRAFERIDLARLWWYQWRAVGRFDRVIACSALDQKRLGRSSVVVVPNGAEVQRRALPESPDAETLLFCGSLAYEPNGDAALYFVREIEPLIRRAVPTVRTLIVGTGPPPEVARLHDGEHVTVHGDVPDVRPYYESAAVVVIPLRTGGGTRLKLLESLALGRPVVTTSVGCEGLDLEDGVHVRVADTPSAFARSCVELLQDAGLRRRLVENGRRLIAERYGWPAIEERMAAIATELFEPASGQVV